MMGWIHVQKREFDQAEELYLKALELKPDSPRVYNDLGNLMKNIGRNADAKKMYLKALALRPNYQAPKRHLEELDRGSNMEP